jgi:hypothetical protein
MLTHIFNERLAVLLLNRDAELRLLKPVASF